MRLEISSAILLNIMRMVSNAAPGSIDKPWRNGDPCPWHEWCGILRGRREDDGSEIVTKADDTANVAADPATSFEIDPAALLAAYRRERRARGLAVLGFFHTHPHSSATPSVQDAACAEPDGKLWVIASLEKVLVWRAVPNGVVHGRFVPVVFDLKTGSSIDPGCSGVQWPQPPPGYQVQISVQRGEL